jgi:YidC/Oxa1 family membrane protein insertase
MNTEKRVLLAALLSVVLLSLYAQLLNKQTPKPIGPAPDIQRSPSEGQQRETALIAKAQSLYYLENEEVISLQSPDLTLEIGVSSGAIRSASRRVFDAIGEQTIRMGGAMPLFRISSRESPLSFRLIEAAQTHATLDASYGTKHYLISYAIDPRNNLVNIELSNTSSPHGQDTAPLLVEAAWFKGDALSDQHNRLEVLALGNGNGKKPSAKHYFAPLKNPVNVPRGTFLLTMADRHFCSSLRPSGGSLAVRIIPSPPGTVVTAAELSGSPKESLSLYLGPRDYFYLKQTGFEEAFPVGVLGKIGLILLWVLKAIAKVTRSYGLAIIVFSALLTCAMAPFTMLSFRSMKKMQELKPEMDQLTAKHKGDPQKAQQEIFALYKRHKVSPLSGCLPMLLQMPIFIALFGAITHFIELRGKPFLWIKDLSLPDQLAQLPFALPILGKDINALPIIMAGAMFFQTKMSQQSAPSGDAQTAAITSMMSGPLMSVLFGVMFYQFPSGLVLYWLTNSIMSIMWYRFSK